MKSRWKSDNIMPGGNLLLFQKELLLSFPNIFLAIIPTFWDREETFGQQEMYI